MRPRCRRWWAAFSRDIPADRRVVEIGASRHRSFGRWIRSWRRRPTRPACCGLGGAACRPPRGGRAVGHGGRRTYFLWRLTATRACCSRCPTGKGSAPTRFSALARRRRWALPRRRRHSSPAGSDMVIHVVSGKQTTSAASPIEVSEPRASPRRGGRRRVAVAVHRRLQARPGGRPSAGARHLGAPWQRHGRSGQHRAVVAGRQV